MKVLLIEGSDAGAGNLKRRLAKEGFSVDAMLSWREGEQKARAAAYDVVIFDLNRSSTDGLAPVNAWRKSNLKTPALMLIDPGSAADKVQNVADLVDLQKDDFLTKPVRWEELLVRVRTLARRSQQTVLRICDMEIDTRSRTVKRGDRHIDLTPKEYSLLHFLACRRGTVMTHTQIHATLYGEREEEASNVVAVYIRYLRTKIDKGFETPLILTRWGEGYLIRGDAS